VSETSPVVLGGSHRSGTTLLRVMLDSHPHIAIGPECSLLTGGFLPEKLSRRFDVPADELWQMRKEASDHAHFVELFFARYRQQRDKPRWGEKTPQNVRHVAWILTHWPKAKFIHVIRDGRDVVCSSRTHPRFRLIDGEKIPTNIRRPLQPCIESWLRDTAAGMRWRGHPQYLEVRYEELVSDPGTALRRVCEFIQETFEPAMLNYHEEKGSSRDANNFVSNVTATKPLKTGAIGRWRRELVADELQLFNNLAAVRMAELGYK
jgi:protein-tyrosine sulfotransferase